MELLHIKYLNYIYTLEWITLELSIKHEQNLGKVIEFNLPDCVSEMEHEQ